MQKRNLSLILLHGRRKVGCREKNGINLEIMQRNWGETVIPVQVRTCLIALYINNLSLNPHANTGGGANQHIICPKTYVTRCVFIFLSSPKEAIPHYIKVPFIRKDHKTLKTFIFLYFSTINYNYPPYKFKWKTTVWKMAAKYFCCGQQRGSFHIH